MKRNILHLFLYIGLVSIGLMSCNGTDETVSPTTNFITLLGNDTLVVESFQSSKNLFSAEAVVRSPQTTIRKYNISFDEAGYLDSYSMISTSATDSTDVSIMSASWDGDSLVVNYPGREGQITRKVYADKNVLPFIDMVHWPFEIALRKAYESGEDIYIQPMFSGARVFDFEIRKIDPGTMTIKHPSRGTMEIKLDPEGYLMALDAGQTTRKLKVYRTHNLQINDFIQKYAALDQAGKSFGGLSGRGSFEGIVHNANITIDFGQPAKRGREIWGNLVPFGQRWRTGANRATHFATDTDLKFDEVEVPAGEYTLFTIPEESGGTLIINQQTGQNGRTYDEAQDLGRVEMNFRDLEGTVELFTIVASENGEDGELRLQWDNKELVIPFSVNSDN